MNKFFQNRWWVVFASACGLMVGSGSINIFAFGVFLKPVTEDLHIGRGFFGSAVGIELLLTTIGTAILGFLLARFGTRRVMIPGLLLCACTLALHSTITANPLWIYFLLGLNGLFFACQSPVPYANVVSHWFDRSRGLALGIAIAGVGLGVALIPRLASFLIAAFGWREGYIGLGVAVLVIAWLPVSIFLREPPGYHPVERRASNRAGVGILPGVLAIDAFKTWRFWSFTLAFFLAIVAINGTLTQIVALLTDRGIPITIALNALSAAGLALIAGRIFVGLVPRPFLGALCRHRFLHHSDGRDRVPRQRRRRLGALGWRGALRSWRRRGSRSDGVLRQPLLRHPRLRQDLRRDVRALCRRQWCRPVTERFQLRLVSLLRADLHGV